MNIGDQNYLGKLNTFYFDHSLRPVRGPDLTKMVLITKLINDERLKQQNLSQCTSIELLNLTLYRNFLTGSSAFQQPLLRN